MVMLCMVRAPRQRSGFSRAYTGVRSIWPCRGLGRPPVEQFEAGFSECVVKRGGDLQPDLIRAIAADDVERGLDLVGIDRLRVVVLAGLVACGPGAIEVVTCAVAISTNPAAVLEDRAGIEIVAEIEKPAVDHLDAVVGIVVDAAV